MKEIQRIAMKEIQRIAMKEIQRIAMKEIRWISSNEMSTNLASNKRIRFVGDGVDFRISQQDECENRAVVEANLLPVSILAVRPLPPILRLINNSQILTRPHLRLSFTNLQGVRRIIVANSEGLVDIGQLPVGLYQVRAIDPSSMIESDPVPLAKTSSGGSGPIRIDVDYIYKDKYSIRVSTDNFTNLAYSELKSLDGTLIKSLQVGPTNNLTFTPDNTGELPEGDYEVISYSIYDYLTDDSIITLVGNTPDDVTVNSEPYYWSGDWVITGGVICGTDFTLVNTDGTVFGISPQNSDCTFHFDNTINGDLPNGDYMISFNYKDQVYNTPVFTLTDRDYPAPTVEFMAAVSETVISSLPHKPIIITGPINITVTTDDTGHAYLNSPGTGSIYAPPGDYTAQVNLEGHTSPITNFTIPE